MESPVEDVTVKRIGNEWINAVYEIIFSADLANEVGVPVIASWFPRECSAISVNFTEKRRDVTGVLRRWPEGFGTLKDDHSRVENTGDFPRALPCQPYLFGGAEAAVQFSFTRANL